MKALPPYRAYVFALCPAAVLEGSEDRLQSFEYEACLCPLCELCPEGRDPPTHKHIKTRATKGTDVPSFVSFLATWLTQPIPPDFSAANRKGPLAMARAGRDQTLSEEHTTSAPRALCSTTRWCCVQSAKLAETDQAPARGRRKVNCRPMRAPELRLSGQPDAKGCQKSEIQCRDQV